MDQIRSRAGWVSTNNAARAQPVLLSSLLAQHLGKRAAFGGDGGFTAQPSDFDLNTTLGLPRAEWSRLYTCAPLGDFIGPSGSVRSCHL